MGEKEEVFLMLTLVLQEIVRYKGMMIAPLHLPQTGRKDCLLFAMIVVFKSRCSLYSY